MSDAQVLKCRDDKAPVVLVKASGGTDTKPLVKLADDCECSWAKKDDEFGPEKLRPRIEPWLTALFQSEHLALLIGSGLSQAVHIIATDSELSVMKPADFNHWKDEINIDAKESARNAGRENSNIEDQIRTANELLRGIEILVTSNKDLETPLNGLADDLKRVIGEFAASILKGEESLISANGKKLEKAFNYLVSFLMSFASRTGTRDRLQIFTTNYDRLVEAGAELAGLHLLDRFVGSLNPIFRSSRLDVDMHYNPPGIRGEPRYLEGVAKITKLHGSLDWVDTQRSIRRIGVPFGAESLDPYLKVPGLLEVDTRQLMIYPNAAKDRETAEYPYVELFRDFAAAVCRPNSTLITYGYGFGDEHINRVVEDMLAIPSTHLVVIAYSDPLRRIMRLYEQLGRHVQITLMIGDLLGDFQTLIDNYLPKPAIDRTTFRMAELLKARWGLEQSLVEDEAEVQAETEGKQS